MRKGKSFIWYLMLLLISTLSFTTVYAEEAVPFLGDANLDLDISAVSEEVLSGNDAIFELNIKVTGNQTVYENLKITIELPDNAELITPLEELDIADVVPQLNEETNCLEYEIPVLEAGMTERLVLKFKTENGETNGTEIKVASEVTASGSGSFELPTRTEATVTVLSSNRQTITKTYSHSEDASGKKLTRLPVQNDLGIWILSINIPNESKGQAYLEPGSEIVIEDVLPAGLDYVSDDSGGVYTAGDRTVRWVFEAPSIEEQKASDALLTKEIQLKTKFSKSQTAQTQITNIMNSTVTLEDGSQSSTSTQGKTQQAPGSNGNPVTPPQGNWFTAEHAGPLDESGEKFGTPANPNPNITAGPDAILRFHVYQSAFDMTSVTRPIEKYETLYTIDPKLEILSIYHHPKVAIAPTTAYPNIGLPPDQAREASVQDVYATVNGVEKKIFTGLRAGDVVNRADFENYNDPSQHISSLKFVSTKRDGGVGTSLGWLLEI